MGKQHIIRFHHESDKEESLLARPEIGCERFLLNTTARDILFVPSYYFFYFILAFYCFLFFFFFLNGKLLICRCWFFIIFIFIFYVYWERADGEETRSVLIDL